MTDAPYVIRPMQLTDVRQVATIERRVFPMPWPSFIYIHEISYNPLSFMGVIESPTRPDENADTFFNWSWLGRYFSRATMPLTAYGGVWMDGEEGHISTIASAPDYRGLGFGELMLAVMLGKAIVEKMKRAVLEVRVGNTKAQKLYLKYGFEITTTKYAYYQDNDEDAHIMTLPVLDENYAQFLRERVEYLHEKINFVDSYSGFTSANP